MPGLYGNVGNTTVSGGNTTGLYSSTTSVTISNNINCNDINAAGNLFVAGTGTFGGNVTAPNFIGNVVGNINGNVTAPGSNTQIIYNDNGILGADSDFTWDESTNVLTVNGNIAAGDITTTGSISATGNITGDYILGNGSQLVGMYGNANVAAYLPTYTGNLAGGNLTIGNNAVVNNDLTVGGTIYGTFSGNISGNLVVPGSNTQVLFNNDGNAGASADLTFNDATNVLTLNGTANVGTVNATGNVLANYFIGNGSQLVGMYGNANVDGYLPIYAGNISANNVSIIGVYSGNGSALLDITGANVTGTVANAAYAANAGNSNTASIAILASYVTANAQANITSVGTLVDLTVSGNSTLGNFQITANRIVDAGNNLVSNVAYPLNSSDAATKGYVDGELSGDLFAIQDDQSNIQGIAKLATITFSGVVNETTVEVSSPDTVTIGLPDDVSIYGNLSSGNVTASGNVTGAYILGNGAFLSGITTTISGNLGGNIEGNGFGIANAAFLTSTGNITGDYIFGNGSQLTGLAATYGNANVANYLPTYSGNLQNVSDYAGNIHAGAISIGPSSGVKPSQLNLYANNFNVVTASGTTLDVSDAFVQVNGEIVANGGNITADYFIGNGSQLTGITSTYGNANVANYLPTFTGNVGAGNIIMTSTAGFIYVNEIKGLGSSPITIEASGGDRISLKANTIRVGNFNADSTISTFGSSDLTIRTNLGDANQGNIRLYDGASGNIDITTNGSGIVNIAGTGGLKVTGNATANYFLGNGSQLTGITASLSGNMVGNINGQGYNIGNLSNVSVANGGNIKIGTVTLTNNSVSPSQLVIDSTVQIKDATIFNGDLGIEDGNGINFYDSDNTNYVGLKGPAVVPSNIEWTLPNADGSSGQALATYGNGVLYWSTTTLSGNLSGNIDGQGYNIGNLSNVSIANGGNLKIGTVTLVNNGVSPSTLNINGILEIQDATIFNGDLRIQDGNGVNFYDNDNTNYVGLKGPGVVTADIEWTLPAADGTSAQALSTYGNGQLYWQSIGLSGNLSGNIDGHGYNIGNVSNVSIQNGGNIAIGTGKIINNSVAPAKLGTDVAFDVGGALTSTGNLSSPAGTIAGNLTVGNLLSNALVHGTSLTITGTSTLGPIQATGNVDITGNMNVTGNLNYANVTDLVVGDPLIYIGANNTGNVYDLGMVVSWNDGTYQHGGWVRDASDGTWKLFGNVVAEPTTTVDFTNATYQPMRAGPIVSTGNITAVNAILSGSLTGVTTISASGNANIGNIGATNAVFTNVAGTLTTAAQPNITSVGTLTSLTVTGNVSGGNLTTTGLVSASGNVSGGNITTTGVVSAGGNVSGGNLTTTGDVTGGTATITGNVAGGNITTVGVVSASGNVSGGNITTIGVVSASGNVSGGNLTTTGLVSASGNVSGGNVIGTYLWGDGSNITGVTAAAASTQIPVKNTSAGTLNKGTPVYATGTVGASTTLEIAGSQSDTSSTMPSIGLLTETLAVNDTGYAISVGTLKNVNTSAYAAGQILYVAASGGLTGTRPTGTNLVQPVGAVGRVDAVNGSIETNIWNYFQLPNLGNGNIWVGNATSFPIEQVAYGNANVANYLPTYSGNITAGNVTATGNIQAGNVISNNTVRANAVTYTGTDGTNGQVLTTYGNGTTYFSTVSGGSGSLSGNLAGNIYANGFALTSLANGNVSITADGTGLVNLSKANFISYREVVYNAGNQTGNLAANIDITNGTIQTLTLTGNITANAIANIATGQNITLILTQDSTGNRLLNSNMKFAGAYKTLSTAASATDIMTVFYDGTNYWASLNIGYA